ncbi:hypothetical protein [Streptomyces yaizuensis]|uniref:Toxin-antitoxin system, toxin component n=1 Tax=Streptomyces yaizuensis TaxID=2989713 RepID=A0ABQ5P6T0_9ACTN|nr:hypothetical protein [Streptomyces sp. YSPA8]GLF98297.1 toxin-antitoxin system, toxin component [Streptomyces sp. YSPA8]
MRRLRDDLARALDQARPADAQEVFAALCAHLGERRGRPVVLRLVDFPPQTASGLYLDLEDRDVICVQAGTPPLHQLIIFGHEVWHMVAGHGGHHDSGPAAAARLAAESLPGPSPEPGRDAPLGAAVHSLAARTDFRQAEENEAEAFGLELGAHLRHWLERAPEAAAPRTSDAQRIKHLLGHHRG